MNGASEEDTGQWKSMRNKQWELEVLASSIVGLSKTYREEFCDSCVMVDRPGQQQAECEPAVCRGSPKGQLYTQECTG